MPLSYQSLNSGDVFILDTGLTLYQWNGSQSSGIEKAKGAELSRAIDDERKGLPTVVVYGNKTSYQSMEEEGKEEEVFWSKLGGKGPIASAASAGNDKEAQKQQKTLFK